MAFGNIYCGKKVLVTGDTGFKGSYLAMWLTALGADVLGVSLAPAGEFSHFELLENRSWESIFCDIREREKLAEIFKNFQPDAVFHLAAQPLVRLSYAESAATIDTNVTGTLNVLESLRLCPNCRSAVIITSDKCYENREDGIPCVESDPMGGFDPYSASKGMAELLVNCYRRSFFTDRKTLIASARAGNVIGGGDWALDRLIPDLMRGAAAGKEAVLRNPDAVRPWQHVFEPLSGYLALGAKLLAGEEKFAGAWNFGPADEEAFPVSAVVETLQKFYPGLKYRIEADANAPHEAALLRLDCSKSRRELDWHGVWDIRKTLEMTARWYAAFYENKQILSAAMLEEYIRDAAEKGLLWTK
ncbi:MAG: CDP-glucose 4,6-dehydratase [Lentisphaeria bacterium]|nr:CDP-glucose 4,6-dehydratase [Lentisphaeria bacterium]